MLKNKTQNNSNNAYNWNTSLNNNNKNNNNLVVPFLDYCMEYITLEELYAAYTDCCKRKRSSKGFLEYYGDWMMNNYRLWKSLNDKTYTIGQSKVFIVTRPKIREVFCAEFKDRIVHHLLINKFGELIESRMIDNSFSCRKEKGVLKGLQSVARQIAEESNNYTHEAWILKCDLQGFFMSINRKLVWRIVKKLIRKNYHNADADWWLWLWKLVILNAPEKNCHYVGDPNLRYRVPRNKSLFYSGGNGLPIGNLPSQVLANLLLSSFDHYALSKGVGYARYADDFLTVSSVKQELLKLIPLYKEFLKEKLKLTMHPSKIYIQEAHNGVTFIGGVIKPGRTYIGNRCVSNMYMALHYWNNLESPNENDLRVFLSTINSYFGFMRHTNSYGIRWKAWRQMNHKNLVYCKNMKVIKQLKHKKI